MSTSIQCYNVTSFRQTSKVSFTGSPVESRSLRPSAIGLFKRKSLSSENFDAICEEPGLADSVEAFYNERCVGIVRDKRDERLWMR